MTPLPGVSPPYTPLKPENTPTITKTTQKIFGKKNDLFGTTYSL